MKTHEALQAAINRKTIDHAKNLGVSASLVHKWQEPHIDWSDPGAYNPLDRVEQIIDKALSLGEPVENALAPLRYLAKRFNMVLIHLPKTTNAACELSRELLQTVKEFGELAQAASAALADGNISRKEAARIEKEAWDLIRQTSAFAQMIKKESE